MKKGCLTIIVIFLLANLVFILLGLKVQKNDEYITSLNKEIAESYKSKGCMIRSVTNEVIPETGDLPLFYSTSDIEEYRDERIRTIQPICPGNESNLIKENRFTWEDGETFICEREKGNLFFKEFVLILSDDKEDIKSIFYITDRNASTQIYDISSSGVKKPTSLRPSIRNTIVTSYDLQHPFFEIDASRNSACLADGYAIKSDMNEFPKVSIVEQTGVYWDVSPTSNPNLRPEAMPRICGKRGMDATPSSNKFYKSETKTVFQCRIAKQETEYEIFFE